MNTASGENFASRLAASATHRPQAIALVCPRPFGTPGGAPRFSFQQLEEESEILARGLCEVGIGPGIRAMFMVPPSFAFFALAFGLFKAGAVLTGVDPGMGRRNVGQCMEEAAPEAFIGIPIAHVLRRWMGWGGTTLRMHVSTSRRRFQKAGSISLPVLRELGARTNQSLPEVAASDPAIIGFTSGSTGPPKGVVYTHGMLSAQLAALRDTFQIEEGETDLVTFPHFALFGPGLGATLVLATMDFGRPGRAIPSWIVRALREYEVTNLFGSPALLSRVGRYGASRGITLPALRRVVSAGAPVPARVVRDMTSMMPGGVFHTPYGATEALPVTSITGEEILRETEARTAEGGGVCVGKPVGDIDLRIIRTSDDPIDAWSDDLAVAAGEVGEIAVSGPVVSRTYFNRPDHTARAKILDGARFFHRMGDLGYVDGDGRLWFCGRKSQRIVTPDGDLYTTPIESVFNTHPDVQRSALVGVKRSGALHPVLCVQLRRRVSTRRWRHIREGLLEMAAARASTAMIRDVLRHRRFPVDRRHNAKIGREELAAWAERRLQ